MEQGYELKLIDMRKAVLEQSQPTELYIPLHGKHTTNPEEEPFDLAQKIQSFFEFNDTSTSDPKVMLLMGDTGSGKSVFSQQLHQQLWMHYKAGDPIPLWIPLPELENPFEGAVEEVFTNYGFSESQISEIKVKGRFIFLVDGYDELHQFQNCYVTNKCDKWVAKVLITCRSQALYYQKDPDKYFMPFNGENRLPLLLRRLYVAPFSKEQISAYVKKFQTLNLDNKISEEDFAKVPGLTELLITPFLLHCAVEALPDILADKIDDQKMTQAKLYDVFIERWFTRQVKKLNAAGLLKDTEQNTKQQFWDYCKKLAQQMHEKEVSVIPYQGKKVGGRLFAKQEQSNIWDNFFNEETEVLRSACPLKRVGDHNYGFVHASMIEYFATRAMYEEIQDDEFNAHNPVIASEAPQSSEMIGLTGSLRGACDDGLRKNNQLRGGIHQRLFSEEKNAIRFLADRIEMNEAFKQKMLLILEASKKSQQFAIGAANAITALVKAGVIFNRQNLSGIKILGADISGGYFDQANLSAADLRQTQMRNVWMREANLEGSHVEGINFGEYPWFKHDNAVVCFDYREDLQRVVTGSAMEVIFWDALTGEQLNKFQGHSKGVTCIQFSPNGEWVVFGSGDNTIRIWEIATGTEVAVLQGHEDFVSSVAFSPNGENVVSGGWDNTVRIWDVGKAEQRHHLKGHVDRVVSVQFSQNGEWVVSGSYDHTIRIWDVASGNVIVLRCDEDIDLRVNSAKFRLDGRQVVSGSEDCMVRLWDVENRQLIAVLHGHEGRVTSVAYSPEGDRVVSGSADNTVRVWDTVSQKILFVLRGHEDGVNYVQFSPDGKRVISRSWDMTLRIWVVGGEQFLARVRGHGGYINSVRFAPDGRLMASASADKTVRIWEVVSGKEHAVLQGHDGSVEITQFSPDGKWVVSAGEDGNVRLWEAESGSMVREFKGQFSWVCSVAFSPYGERVVAGSGKYRNPSNDIRLWEARSGKQLMVLTGHKDAVRSVAFSHDGNRVFSVSDDNTLRVWEISSEKELTRWHCKNIESNVAFSSNGDLAAYGGAADGGSGYVQIVDMENGETIFEISLEYMTKSVQFIGDSQHIMIGCHKTIQIWEIAARQRLIVWKFHCKVNCFSYHNNGSLIVGYGDHSIACWQKTGDMNNDHLELRWSTYIDSPNLYVEGLRESGVIGLSDQNRRLLEQRGAMVDVKAESNSNALTKLIVHRAGSPIHHKPDSPRLQQKELVLVLSTEDQELKERSDLEVIQQNSSEIEEKNDMEDDKKGCHCCVIF